jgi:Lar family restriction alleviation protein
MNLDELKQKITALSDVDLPLTLNKTMKNEGKAIEPSSQLLPCPFCGGDADVHEVESVGGGGRVIHRAECVDCDANQIGHARHIDAVKAWNARTNREHVYWKAGEPDCPRDIKAGNGELFKLRCKVCGSESPRGYCNGTRSQPSTPTEGLCVVCRRTESDHRPDDHAFYRRPSTPTEVKLCECGCDRLEHPNGLGCRFDHFLACKVYRPKGDK